MDDYENEVEMTEPSGRSNRGKKKGPNGTRGNIKNVSTVVVDEDGIVLDHAIRRQNSCCIFMFAVILIAASAFVVSQFYSMPQELDTFATGEGGGGGVDSGIVGNDVVNSEQQEKKNNQNGFGGAGGTGVGGADRMSVEEWLANRGKTPHLTKDDPRWANRPKPGNSTRKGKLPMDYPGVGFPGRPMPSGKHFDRKSWFTSTVTLADGKMFDVVRQLQHDPTAFTEGLAFADGVLWESTGLNGKSTIRTLDKLTGEVIESYPLANRFFGEGLTLHDGKAIQLTYKRKVGLIWDMNDLGKDPETFRFDSTTGEGWGLTFDTFKNEFIMSDGSEFLHFWDPKTFEQIRKVKVKRQNSKKGNNINELEFWHGRVLANVWYEDTILVINPESGVVEKEYDFSSLYPSAQRQKDGADVLNGISASDDPSMIYVTGKNWDRMYLVTLKF